ncbi:MAG: hypothetical protein ABIC57_03195 [bacterium]
MTKKLLGVIIFSVITVLAWIGHEVWMKLGSEEIQLNYQDYLETVNAEFDDETLEELSSRESEYMMIDITDLD